jgi:hypothetical protein
MRPWAHPVTHENPASFAFRFTQQETGNPKPETLFSEQAQVRAAVLHCLLNIHQ